MSREDTVCKDRDRAEESAEDGTRLRQHGRDRDGREGNTGAREGEGEAHGKVTGRRPGARGGGTRGGQ